VLHGNTADDQLSTLLAKAEVVDISSLGVCVTVLVLELEVTDTDQFRPIFAAFRPMPAKRKRMHQATNEKCDSVHLAHRPTESDRSRKFGLKKRSITLLISFPKKSVSLAIKKYMSHQYGNHKNSFLMM
jgi:hypothetical protein